MQNEITIYTDGGCSGNPGPGGWAFVVSDAGHPSYARSGGDADTTNNRMELKAVIEALTHVRSMGADRFSVSLYTDSQYVKNGITLWIHAWKKNGWRTSSKDPVKNQDLWMELDALVRTMRISWNWVKGHAGVEMNEICDSLVRNEMGILKKKL
jgi:ribonuclease HI